MEQSKITIEFTLYEAMILCKAIAGHNPAKEDEMISVMLYARIKNKIEEKTGRH